MAEVTVLFVSQFVAYRAVSEGPQFKSSVQ